MKRPKLTIEPGQKFERLEVIREVDPVKGKRKVLCKCKCGEQPVVDLYQLLEGRTKSCGCLQREKLALGRLHKDLTDQQFVRLKALRRDGNKVVNKSAVWVCECQCGEVISVTARDLVSGNTKSCGCLMRDHTRSLTEYNKEHQTVDGVFVPLLRQKVQTNNKTGVKGVSVRFEKNGQKKYLANITVDNARHYVGIYSSKKAAVSARKKAEEKFHKPYLDKYNTRKCETCGESFTPSQKTARFCSTRCRYRDQARRKRLRRSDDGRCPQCGGEWIEPVQTGIKKPKHCRKCQEYYKSRREQKK